MLKDGGLRALHEKNFKDPFLILPVNSRTTDIQSTKLQISYLKQDKKSLLHFTIIIKTT